MAIIITRGLTSLVSVFNQQSIEFTVPNGTTGVAVSIGAYTFIPIRTSTVTVDTYYMDLSDILKYILGLPNDEIFASYNTYSSATCTVSISATGQTTVTTVGKLCFGYDYIGDETIPNGVAVNGAIAPQYHYGQICFYNYAAAGNYSCTVAGVSYTYALLQGYNDLVLHSTQAGLSGTFTVATTTISFPIVRVEAQGTDYIKWIDKEGRYHKMYVRQLMYDNDSKSSNSIPSYYQTHPLTKQKSIDISRELKSRYTADVVAKDDIHYKQLTEIINSVIVQYNGYRMKVTSSNASTATCRQNLHFTITLEQEQYVPTY